MGQLLVGGMMLRDGSRRRTPGGIFFHLAYTTGRPKEGRTLERPVYKKPKKGKQPVPPQQSVQAKPTQQTIPVFIWNDRLATMKEAEQEKGNATVKITVIGSPEQCVLPYCLSSRVFPKLEVIPSQFGPFE